MKPDLKILPKGVYFVNGIGYIFVTDNSIGQAVQLSSEYNVEIVTVEDVLATIAYLHIVYGKCVYNQLYSTLHNWGVLNDNSVRVYDE